MRVLRRLLLIVSGFLLAIVLIECGLSVAASVSGQRMAEKMMSSDPQNRPIIAFCGDSNIYGVYVDNEATLPRAVERISRQDGLSGIRGINLGIPGQASWNVLDQIRRAVVAKPRAIIVTCGINNYSIRPLDAGLGPIENLKIVKMVRRSIFNYQISKETSSSKVLMLGPGGAAIDGKHLILGNDHGAVVVKDREGNELLQERRPNRNTEDPEILVRFRKDLLEMILLAKEANTKILLATYFAGEESPFDKLTAVFREVSKMEGVGLADCASALLPCIQKTLGKPLSAASPVEIQNYRGALLTADRHPTEIGYEIEARIIVDALRRMDILPKGVLADPSELLRGIKLPVPALRWRREKPTEFIVETQPNASVILYLGQPGTSHSGKMLLPINCINSEKIYKKYSAGSFEGNAGVDGICRIEVQQEILDDLPRPVVATCVVTHGSGGSGRSFLANPIEILK